VFSTAGNQLVGEAMWLGKPMLVMPEYTVEQRLNAAAVERLGIGMQVRQDEVTSATLTRFLGEEARFREAAVREAKDGRVDAISTLETFARELARNKRRAPSRAWRYA
jgi:UDP:flavonoid glycosyltransferase YjiC (YdhE family)